MYVKCFVGGALGRRDHNLEEDMRRFLCTVAPGPHCQLETCMDWHQ
jgi:hypothetical protein